MATISPRVNAAPGSQSGIASITSHAYQNQPNTFETPPNPLSKHTQRQAHTYPSAPHLPMNSSRTFPHPSKKEMLQPVPLVGKGNKSSTMRAAANKRKETKTWASIQSRPGSDSEYSDTRKVQRDRTTPHSIPRRGRRHRRTDENLSSADDERRTARSTSIKRDTHPTLPPIRRSRAPPPFDEPIFDYPIPVVVPVRGQFPYYPIHPPYVVYPSYPSRYDYRSPYGYQEDHYPYPHDSLLDHPKDDDHARANGSKHNRAPLSHPPSHTTKHEQIKNARKKLTAQDDSDENDAQHDRSPTYDDDRDPAHRHHLSSRKTHVQDAANSQYTKSDSYVENQRRRAVRDAQGYYFPYKRYTLHDYKGLQKLEAHSNPYAPLSERTRQSHGDKTASLTDRDNISKRDRALEYAKVQVKHPERKSTRSNATHQYVNSLFPPEYDDQEGSINERQSKNNQSGDDDDDGGE